MAEFYLWTGDVTTIVTLLFALCVLSQTLATVVSFYRYPRNRIHIFETLLELSILGNVFVCSLLHGATREARLINILVPTGYVNARIAIFAVIVVLALIITLLSKKIWPLLAIATASLTLPIMEKLTGNTFAYIYIAAILLWLIRSIPIGFWRYREIRTGISELSVKHLIDSLHTGVLFCEREGFILLSNTQMQRLMTDITGKVERNGQKFYEMLLRGEIDPRCQITQLENQNVIILPDGSAWIFTMTELPIKRKTYSQLTATDITERWKLTAELQEQNKDLSRRQEELTEAIANLHVISRERETQKAKIRTHDILSGRLTLLRNAIHKEQKPDYSMLRTLSEGLIEELRSAEGALAPQDELDIMKQTFASIGVDILFDGSLPADSGKGQLFVDIAREAITNAVRHGLATQVRISAEEVADESRMQITNNGHGSSEIIKEGGGITGMRRRLSEWSGELAISTASQFSLNVAIPGK